MKRLKLGVKSRIYGMCAAIVSLLIVALCYVTFEVRKTATLVSGQRASVEMLQVVEKTRVQFLTVQYWHNEFALSWQIASRDKAVEARKVLDGDLVRLSSLDPEFTQVLRDKVDQFEKKMNSAAEVFVEGNRILGAELSTESSVLAAQVFKSLNEKLANFNGKNLDILTTTDQIVEQSNYLSKAGFFLTVVGLVLSILISAFVGHQLSKRLQGVNTELEDSGTQVSQASNELSRSSKALSESASHAASFLEETAASIEELSSMVKKNADYSKEAADLSKSGYGDAQKGQQEIQDLITAMHGISKSSKKIEEIINVIDDIAFQTNLLALNAAVEAARAGEQGKGFAVVAEAVRSLAQKSSVAAGDISKLIKESVEQTQLGTQTADRGGVALKGIVESIGKITELNQMIALASNEQSEGISQINKTIVEMDELTQKNAEGAGAVAESSQQLSAQAETLQKCVGNMNQIISGEGVVVNAKIAA
ncbi:MAG: methyl-accepting chemotaxis protein [Pseudomonadota bacterium]|nr:methyl-accepting chemotaxis protein [Pseudomonadota bacterium]